MADALLSDLCRICYTSTPKYKCPRCSTQTCSLTCYKKHQQRANCSGVRDPATYLKKSQWATPAGIDRDYNYLRGVEQQLERASSDAQTRGIGVRPTVSKNIARGQRPDSVLQRYLAEHEITVERAPVGMSRQKGNRTRPTKRGNVVWSVEWWEDGVAEVQHDCMESATVGSLFESWRVERMNRARGGSREDGVGVRGTKRKREVAKAEPQPALEMKRAASTSRDADGSEVQPLEAVPITSEDLAIAEEAEQPSGPSAMSESTSSAAVEASLLPSTDPGTATKTPAVDQPPPLYFYLVKPNTATSKRVLLPISNNDTLTQALRHRFVQEYPTIYVLPQGPESLPTDFVLASAYTDHSRSQLPAHGEVSTFTQRSGGGHGRFEPRNYSNKLHHQPEAAAEEELDPQAVLEMLRRDVTT